MRSPLTLDQIQFLTKHETTDGVRMALKRAGVKAQGVSVDLSLSGWPPKKWYETNDIWRVFGTRILKNAEQNPEIKQRCWEVFSEQIAQAISAQEATRIFGTTDS